MEAATLRRKHVSQNRVGKTNTTNRVSGVIRHAAEVDDLRTGQQNRVGKTNTTNRVSGVIRHAAEVDDLRTGQYGSDLMLQSTLGGNVNITQQLLSSSHSFQVGFQGLLVRAITLLCLRPEDLDLRVEVHFNHLEDRLSLPALRPLVKTFICNNLER